MSSSEGELLALNRSVYGLRQDPSEWLTQARELLEKTGLGDEFLANVVEHVRYMNDRMVPDKEK